MAGNEEPGEAGRKVFREGFLSEVSASKDWEKRRDLSGGVEARVWEETPRLAQGWRHGGTEQRLG